MQGKNFAVSLFALAILIGLLGFFILNNKIVNNEHPTKEEWLEIAITHRIEDWTDPWQQRIAIGVTIFPEDKEIVVTLTSANGQEEISQSSKNGYVRDIENIVKTILEEYNWAKNHNK